MPGLSNCNTALHTCPYVESLKGTSSASQSCLPLCYCSTTGMYVTAGVNAAMVIAPDQMMDAVSKSSRLVCHHFEMVWIASEFVTLAIPLCV
jgi:hypothetical protein